MKQKVILAFSGGLDTSFCTVYLKEKGLDVITATIDTGGLSNEELDAIKARSKELGAVKHICVDAKKEIFGAIYETAMLGKPKIFGKIESLNVTAFGIGLGIKLGPQSRIEIEKTIRNSG